MNDPKNGPEYDPKNDKRIKLLLAYDGTNYCGWQIQKKGITVQEVMQEALAKVHKSTQDKRYITVTAAGRTDSGVHAEGQVAHINTCIMNMPGECFAPALNRCLPKDIRVLKSCETHENFHARFDAKARVYHYYIYQYQVCPPFLAPYCLCRPSIPHLALLNACARILVGTKDFSAFAAAGDPSPSKIRTIHTAAFMPNKHGVTFTITGNGFLWKMVRSIVGTIFEVAEKKDGPELLRNILLAGDRKEVGTTAPARGLFLHKVYYNG